MGRGGTAEARAGEAAREVGPSGRLLLSELKLRPPEGASRLVVEPPAPERRKSTASRSSDPLRRHRSQSLPG
jgi:hypothetical protein